MKKNPSVPDFFIVGAPKCGTTALYEYLCQHPEVYLPQDPKTATSLMEISYKEPHFFADDLNFPGYIKEEELYLSLYQGHEHLKTGDASVFDLYSQTASKKIHTYNPGAKIIIILRNPVEMIYSLHRENIYGLVDPDTDFESAINKEEFRQSGADNSISNKISPSLLTYLAIGRYGEQVKRYFENFPHNQICIIAYEDFRNDNMATLNRVCAFLDVDSGFQFSELISNPNQEVKSVKIQRILFWRPRNLQRIVRRILPRSVRHGIATFFIQLNSPVKKRSPLSSKLKAKLENSFRDDAKLLDEITGRNFSAQWFD